MIKLHGFISEEIVIENEIVIKFSKNGIKYYSNDNLIFQEMYNKGMHIRIWNENKAKLIYNDEEVNENE